MALQNDVDIVLNHISNSINNTHNDIYTATQSMNIEELKTLVANLLEAQQQKETELLRQMYALSNLNMVENYAQITDGYSNKMYNSMQTMLAQRPENHIESENSKLFL